MIFFKNWDKGIAKFCELKVVYVEGEYDNAQYMPELVPFVINIMKLFPCWLGIMIEAFKFGEKRR